MYIYHGGDRVKKLTFVMLIITFILFLGLGTFSNPTVANIVDSEDADRDLFLNIITTNKMEYEMVKALVGDKHNIQYIFTNEEDSERFIINNNVVNNISNMDLFLYSGDSLDKWCTELIGKLNKSSVGTIDITRGIRTSNIEVNNETKVNPYFYTGIDEYKVLLYNVKSAIQDKDPKNRDFYEENYNKITQNLDKVVSQVKENKKDLGEYKFIALDSNLDYFYKSLGISPIKLPKDKSVQQYVEENKIDVNKLIILKDVGTPFSEEGYKVVNLEKYNNKVSIEELIENNYKNFYNFIEIKENK